MNKEMGAASAFNMLVQSAREANLADYFMKSGYTVKRHGAELYIEEFPGLCVNTRTNSWYSHYEAVGGHNAIDCLVKICGRDFKQAVYELTGEDIPRYVPEKAEPLVVESKELVMPPPADNMRRVFAYFCKERGIPADIVTEFAKAGLLYQSASEVKTDVNGESQIIKPPNAVFVHRNADGAVVGGEVQGINSFRRYKGLVSGTRDSVFTLRVQSDCTSVNTQKAYLFESGIDLMSFYTLADREQLQGVSLISMSGLKPTVPKQMQADGLTVLSFVDNDEAGRKFESVHGFKRGSNALEQAELKDWNDYLRHGGGKITAPSIAPDTENTKGATR